MYLERPKSPSFTQSMEDTSTFLAAMSLHKTHIHLGALRPANWGKTVLSVWRSSVTCARSVCSPGTPALCTADRRTESAWTGRGCTSLFARTTSTKTNQTVLNGDFQSNICASNEWKHSLTSPSVHNSMMIQTGFSVMIPISFTMCGWSNCRIVTVIHQKIPVWTLLHVQNTFAKSVCFSGFNSDFSQSVQIKLDYNASCVQMEHMMFHLFHKYK